MVVIRGMNYGFLTSILSGRDEDRRTSARRFFELASGIRLRLASALWMNVFFFLFIFLLIHDLSCIIVIECIVLFQLHINKCPCVQRKSSVWRRSNRLIVAVRRINTMSVIRRKADNKINFIQKSIENRNQRRIRNQLVRERKKVPVKSDLVKTVGFSLTSAAASTESIDWRPPKRDNRHN